MKPAAAGGASVVRRCWRRGDSSGGRDSLNPGWTGPCCWKSVLATLCSLPSLLDINSFMGSVSQVLSLAVAGAAVAFTGCSSMEHKLGRGIANVMEPVRMGEFTRSTEQTYLADGPVVARSYGYVHGVTRTVQRTVVGAFEIATFPIPSEPLIVPNEPVFPDSVVPEMSSNLGVSTDRYVGLDGGGAFLSGIGSTSFNPAED